jgi:hypothetical protein
VTQIIETFSAEFLHSVRDRGIDTRRPVFIFGLPRSGATLAEQILAGHSQVFGEGELTFGQDDFLAPAGEPAAKAGIGAQMDQALRNLSRADPQTIQRISRQHLMRLDKLDSSASRIVDKMPDNYLGLGLLATLFPQSTFIHCLRDLCDVALSCWMTQFSSMPWASISSRSVGRRKHYTQTLSPVLPRLS